MQITGVVLVATALGLSGLGAGSAFAASANPMKALSTSRGGTTCGHFLSLSKSGQDHLVRRLVRAAPGGTLATIPPSSNGNSSGSGVSEGTKNATVESMAPLKASDIVAACQAATSASTLRDAYQKFATGGSASNSQ
jgi:hypothetical protein